MEKSHKRNNPRPFPRLCFAVILNVLLGIGLDRGGSLQEWEEIPFVHPFDRQSIHPASGWPSDP